MLPVAHKISLANSSIGLPFPIYDTLSLKVRYDDGFVAYINGTEVARDRAGGSPGTPLSYDATSSSSHTDSQAEDFQPFLISQHIDLLKKGNNVLAVHGLNVSAGSSDFLIDAALDATEGIGGSNGGLADSAIPYEGPVSLMRSETQVKARVFSGNEWSALTEATFITDADAASSTNLVVSKIHYRPASATEEEIAAGHKNRNDFEYIELMNIGDKNIDLAGVLFEKGIDFKFDNGNSLVIEPNKRVLIVENLEAFNLRFGSNLPILGEFDNNSNLSNGLIDGEEVNRNPPTDPKLADTDGDGLTDLDELNTFNTEPTKADTDDDGFSDSTEISSGSNPKNSDSVPSFPTLDNVLISEFMANNDATLQDSDEDSSDWIELWNPTDTAISLANHFLTDFVAVES